MSKDVFDQQYIDSRDVIDQLNELRAERDEVCGLLDEKYPDNDLAENAPLPIVLDFLEEKGEDLDYEDLREKFDQLDKLEKLNEEGEQECEDWEHGVTMIREDAWVEYVQDLVSDIGDMPREIPHYIVVDWEATSRNIAVDYSQIKFDDSVYYIR